MTYHLNVRSTPHTEHQGFETYLVSAAKAGNHEAFVALVQQTSSTTARVIQRITRNPVDTEDVLQDAIMRAYIKITTFDERSSFSSWFTRIGINSAYMLLRRRRSRHESSLAGDAADHETRRELQDMSPGPEAAYLSREGLARLAKAMKRLNAQDRDLIEMTSDGKSVPEAACLTGLSLPAAKARLFRGRRMLRERLHLTF